LAVPSEIGQSHPKRIVEDQRIKCTIRSFRGSKAWF
jgi:hypothetical protein